MAVDRLWSVGRGPWSPMAMAIGNIRKSPTQLFTRLFTKNCFGGLLFLASTIRHGALLINSYSFGPH